MLKFTPDTLAGIFLGDITNWKDDKLVADNPAAGGHRPADCGRASLGWLRHDQHFHQLPEAPSATPGRPNVGAGTSVNWPTGIGQKGNAGIAGAIAGVPYALGYVELAYAEQNGLPNPLIQNKAGNFVGATTDTVTNAAAGVEIPEDERIMIVNGEGDNTYPIAGFTWLLVCPNQTDAAKATALTRMLWWATHDGQAYHADAGLFAAAGSGHSGGRARRF